MKSIVGDVLDLGEAAPLGLSRADNASDGNDSDGRIPEPARVVGAEAADVENCTSVVDADGAARFPSALPATFAAAGGDSKAHITGPIFGWPWGAVPIALLAS